MKKQEVLDSILEVGIIPVVRVSSHEHAILAVDAVRLGGIPIAEITMTVPGAVDLIAKLDREMGTKVLIGAGTVLDAITAQACVNAGAQFLVSPNLDIPTVDLATRNDIVMLAGALTPTEVVNANSAGADFVKIFPCGLVGGPRYIKALRGPLPHIRMVPTGGVNLDTAADFIAAGASALGIGGELIQPGLLRAGNTDAIAQAARQYREIVSAARKRARGTKNTLLQPLS